MILISHSVICHILETKVKVFVCCPANLNKYIITTFMCIFFMENQMLWKLIVLLKFCNFQSFLVIVQLCDGINRHMIYYEFGVDIRKFCH